MTQIDRSSHWKFKLKFVSEIPFADEYYTLSACEFLLTTEQILITLEGNEVPKVEDAVFEFVLCGGSWCLSNIAFLLKTCRESQLVAFHFNVEHLHDRVLPILPPHTHAHTTGTHSLALLS